MKFKSLRTAFQNESPLTNSQLKVVLDDVISPKLKHLGLTNYNGKYTWYSEFNELGIKKVFHYQLFKGPSGTFTYGHCFDFIPTFSGSGALINHRSPQSTRLHLHEITEGWRNSFLGDVFEDRTSHYGIKKCRKSIDSLLKKYMPIMEEWWQNNQTYQQNIQTADQQIKEGGAYNLFNPNSNYFKAFLLAKMGDKEVAIKIIEQELKPYIFRNSKFEYLKQKLILRLNNMI